MLDQLPKNLRQSSLRDFVKIVECLFLIQCFRPVVCSSPSIAYTKDGNGVIHQDKCSVHPPTIIIDKSISSCFIKQMITFIQCITLILKSNVIILLMAMHHCVVHNTIQIKQYNRITNMIATQDVLPVSYTHLDVYKRQHTHVFYVCLCLSQSQTRVSHAFIFVAINDGCEYYHNSIKRQRFKINF